MTNKTTVYKYKDGELIDTIYPETPKHKPADTKEVKGATKRKSKKDLTLQEEDSESTEEVESSSK